MSTTLWIGIIAIVCLLELVRIAMSSYVLVHILESRALRRQHEEPGLALRGHASRGQRARREALLDPTLLALRAAMDEVARGHPGEGVERAIGALDDYALALAGMEQRR